MHLMFIQNGVRIDKSKTGVTIEAGNTYPAGPSEFTPSFNCVDVSL